MNRDSLHTYYLKLTTLTPVHIGTGEVYEPTSFVIDDGKLFEFDEVAFYKNLTSEEKNKFLEIVTNWLDVLDFYRSKVEEAKEIAFFECSVTKAIEERYKTLNNKDGTRNKNQFQIHRTFKNPNTHQPIIPGSSLKGMFDTLFKIYPSSKSSNQVRQRLIVSDAIVLEGGVEIGFANRIHKKPSKSAKSKIPQMLEIIQPNSTFELTITTEYTFEEIQKMVKNYYNERKQSMVKTTVDGFIARVGKYSGKEYMVDDIKHGLNSFQKPVATHTLYEVKNQQFGWIEIEDSIAKKNRIEKEIADEEQRVNALTPFQKLMEQYKGDITQLINDMKAQKIDNYDAIKLELAQEVKKELQKTPKTWDKAKKKALDRKNFIEGLLKN